LGRLARVRLEALADAPGAFSSARSDWEFADEQRWRQRLEVVPFNAIAVLDHADVGQVSGTDLGDDRCVELISMWVSPAVRGTGVADALIEVVSEWARGRGAAGIRLSVRRSNERAQRLYSRAGFVFVDGLGDEPVEVAMVRSLKT
jgi:ribosomal protein S18 acetylase RimI-like enzyme